MYVCNCNGLREKDVRAVIAEGADHPLEVYERHGCAPRCGRCKPDMQRLIEEARAPLLIAAE
ncbi:MAG: (2Fe-2S)-binding protein [Alphaproteobacteria bacterium]|nr:(2Fe-2S)-binding protein [Alphaproteobacteria bacterium]